MERVETIEKWINKHNLKTAYMSGSVAAGIIGLKATWDYFVAKIK